MRSIFPYLFNGQKAVRLEDLPEDAWTFVTGRKGRTAEAKALESVAFFYRCVEVRSNAVATLPFEIVDQTDRQKVVFDSTQEGGVAHSSLDWLEDLSPLLGMADAAYICSGRAYWEKRTNVFGSKILGLDWVLPWSLKPEWEGSVLRGFQQPQNPHLELIPADAIVSFFPPDFSVEKGPGNLYPGKAVLSSVGVIHNLDQFLSGYFQRGLVKATLLKYKDKISEPEKKLVKDWWQRVMTGIGNVFATEVVRGDFETMVIGEGIKDLRDNTLLTAERESIAVGLGIPIGKLLPESVNRSTRDTDEASMILDTALPDARWISRHVNRQLLHGMGLHLRLTPQKLNVLQEDEHQRAQALKSLTDSGVPLLMALDILGFHLTDEDRDELKEMTKPVEIAPSTPPTDVPGDVENASELPEEKDSELGEEPQKSLSAKSCSGSSSCGCEKHLEEFERYKRWVEKRAPFDSLQELWEFKSDLLSVDQRLSYWKAELLPATNDEIPDLPSISDLGLEEALQDVLNSWDSLLPDFEGMLAATPTKTKSSAYWTWDPTSRRYRVTSEGSAVTGQPSGTYISQTKILSLRDQWATLQADDAASLARRYSEGSLSLSKWVKEMRSQINEAYIGQYLLAHGGHANMTPADWGRIGAAVKQQYGYLQGLAEALKAGEISEADLVRRARMYVDGSVTMFERANALGRGMPELPEYPGDGTQQCLSNCRCHWKITEKSRFWKCTWKLNSGAENCETCKLNAQLYNPLIIDK